MVTVADCERVQLDWFARGASVSAGAVWTDGPLTWTDGPQGLNLMFPRTLDAGALRRGLALARERRLGIVGAWLGLAVDASALAEVGFERGWSPWWMTAELSRFDTAADPRVVSTYHPDLEAWQALAYDGAEVVGSAWSFPDGDLAGIFDMWVAEKHQRRGLGSALLDAVCVAAHEAGAVHAVLNATWEGKQLYRTRGFTQIGEGITWWHHLHPEPPKPGD